MTYIKDTKWIVSSDENLGRIEIYPSGQSSDHNLFNGRCPCRPRYETINGWEICVHNLIHET